MDIMDGSIKSLRFSEAGLISLYFGSPIWCLGDNSIGNSHYKLKY